MGGTPMISIIYLFNDMCAKKIEWKATYQGPISEYLWLLELYFYFVLKRFLISNFLLLLLKDFIYLFLKSSEGREKEREGNNQCVVACHVPPTGDLAHNPGMCPDWELNQ